ncbi:MAG: hypothetical protein K2Y40_05355 [Reyranella sp.]|nr:hypothetical protein [Reyranella sp.]
MKATVIEEFDGAKDGAIYPTKFKPGDVIEGDLARVAVAEKWATEGDSTKGAETGNSGSLPDGWAKMNVPNMLELARRHGAGDDVTTRAHAVDYLKKVEAGGTGV